MNKDYSREQTASAAVSLVSHYFHSFGWEVYIEAGNQPSDMVVRKDEETYFVEVKMGHFQRDQSQYRLKANCKPGVRTAKGNRCPKGGSYLGISDLLCMVDPEAKEAYLFDVAEDCLSRMCLSLTFDHEDITSPKPTRRKLLPQNHNLKELLEWHATGSPPS